MARGRPSRKLRTQVVSEKALVAVSTNQAVVYDETSLPGVSSGSKRSAQADDTSLDTPPDIADAVASLTTMPGAAQATPAGVLAMLASGHIRIRGQHFAIAAFALWALAGGWTFIQDNEAGKLDTNTGLGRWLVKIAFITLFMLLIEAAIAVFGIVGITAQVIGRWWRSRSYATK